ncbi:MAG: RluA family pseudouridine synthase [Candidatus Moraniibacteriota bacterium]
MTQQKGLIVKGKYNGSRLDQYLVQAPFVWPKGKPGRVAIQELITLGAIRVNGNKVRPGYRVKPGETVTLEALEKKKSVRRPPLPPIPVLFEDDSLIVIDKPAGLSMHPVRKGQKGTLVDWILKKYPTLKEIGDDPLRPGIVHRLDKESSGIIVLTKTQDAFLALKSLFQGRKVKKEYAALVYGVTREKKGLIELPLGRVRGGIRRGTPVRKRSFAGEMRPAETEYKLLTAYSQHSLLSLKPKTGRTHQIRVHLASIGNPVVGDLLYRFKIHRKDILSPPHQLLHAKKLSFTLLKGKYAFESELPDYFQRAIQTLDEKKENGYDGKA